MSAPDSKSVHNALATSRFVAERMIGSRHEQTNEAVPKGESQDLAGASHGRRGAQRRQSLHTEAQNAAIQESLIDLDVDMAD